MEFLLIVLLTLLNGAFAMSELALASSRKARLAAMESGAPTYAGFAVDTNAGHSAIIVFRDPREGEPANRPVALTRWMSFPQGVYHQSEQLQAVPVQPARFPRLGTNRVASVSSVRFDRFGRLSPATQPVVIQLGAKANQTAEYMGGTNNYFEVTIQPLTGRAAVVDKAMEGAR